MAPKTFIAPMPSQTDSTNVKLKERCSDADAAHFRQNAADHGGCTAVMLAAKEGHLEIVRYR